MHPPCNHVNICRPTYLFATLNVHMHKNRDMPYAYILQTIISSAYLLGSVWEQSAESWSILCFCPWVARQVDTLVMQLHGKLFFFVCELIGVMGQAQRFGRISPVSNVQSCMNRKYTSVFLTHALPCVHKQDEYVCMSGKKHGPPHQQNLDRNRTEGFLHHPWQAGFAYHTC